jgi:hypothetical protein
VRLIRERSRRAAASHSATLVDAQRSRPSSTGCRTLLYKRKSTAAKPCIANGLSED